MNACCRFALEQIARNEHLEGGVCCLVDEKTDAPPVAKCPISKNAWKKVQLRTVRSLVRGQRRWQLEHAQYYYCEDPSCEVVYFRIDDNSFFTTADFDVKVFVKERGDDVPVCYCFEWTTGRIRKEIELTGKSTAAVEIARQMKAGLCACDVKNPKGTCCLAEVNNVIREVIADRLV